MILLLLCPTLNKRTYIHYMHSYFNGKSDKLMHFILGNNDVPNNKASPDDPLNFNNDQNKGSKSTIKEQNNDKNGENEDDIAKNDDTIAENDSVTPNIDENDDDIAKDDNDVTKNDDGITESDDKMAESEGENDDGVTENGTGNNTDNENDDGVTENGNGNNTDNENNIVSEDENSRTSMNDGYTLKNGEIDDTDDIDQDMPEDSLEGGRITHEFCNLKMSFFFARNTLLGYVKFQISILCGVLKTTNHQKLTQRTIDPLDTRSHPQGVPPI